jgi:hypothetical protein
VRDRLAAPHVASPPPLLLAADLSGLAQTCRSQPQGLLVIVDLRTMKTVDG